MHGSQAERNTRGVIGDDRGAIMVIAVFFAIFGVAMLYLAIGAGESVLFREHVQDAADSAALTGAIAHARMMNLLVLINVIMAALLAILVAIKTIESLATIGIAVAGGLAFITAGASLAAIPPLAALRSSMSTAYDAAKTPIFPALQMLKQASDVIAQAGPGISALIVSADIAAHKERGAISDGLASSTVLANDAQGSEGPGLPVQDDQYQHLCKRAGNFAAMVAMKPLEELGMPGALTHVIRDAMGELTESLSNWFCEDREKTAPELPQRLDVGVPKQQAREDACKRDMPPVEPAKVKNYKDGATRAPLPASCQQLEDFNNRAKPDAEGNCRREPEFGGDANCGENSPYEQVVAQARAECDPSKNPRPFNYAYQLQKMRVKYHWDGKRWVRGRPEVLASSLVHEADGTKPPSPCGRQDPWHVGDWATIAEGYQRKLHPDDDPITYLPVCTTEAPPTEVPAPRYGLSREGKSIELPVEPEQVTFLQVTNILSCQQTREVKLLQGNASSPGSKGGGKKAPKRIRHDVSLGAEELQIRALVLANQQQRESARLVRLGLWGKPDPNNPLERLRQLGGFAVAQAEYFYQTTGGETGDNDTDKMMWNMNWRARLRRVQLPTSEAASNNFREVCVGTLGAKCSSVLDVIDDWSDTLGH